MYCLSLRGFRNIKYINAFFFKVITGITIIFYPFVLILKAMHVLISF